MSETPDFSTMSNKQLKDFAQTNEIDLEGSKKKSDVVLILNNHYNKNNEEELTMEDNKALNEEMVANTEVGTDVPAAAVEEKKVWKDAAGEEVSMSQFIREQFTVNNLSRKDISDKFDINYRTVYGATVNMENEAEPSTRGRGVVNPKIQVTADGKVYTTKTVDGTDVHLLDNIEVPAEQIAGLEVTEADRNTWIKEQVAAGINRGDVAKALDLSYGVVYGLTKEEDGTRTKHEVEITEKDGSITKMPRSEYIRKKVAEGISKSDVAKELGVEYSVIWQATKKDKSDADRFAEAIAGLEKFTEKISDKEVYAQVLAELSTLSIVEPVVEEKAEPAAK